jgi:hypothetical protein
LEHWPPVTTLALMSYLLQDKANKIDCAQSNMYDVCIRLIKYTVNYRLGAVVSSESGQLGYTRAVTFTILASASLLLHILPLYPLTRPGRIPLPTAYR